MTESRLDPGEVNQFISWVDLTLDKEGLLKLANFSDFEMAELLDRYYADKAATDDFKYWSRSTEPGNRGKDDPR